MLDQYTFHNMKISWLDGVMLNTDGGTLFGPVPKAVWQRYYPVNELNQIPSVTDPILIQYKGKNYLIDTSLTSEKHTDKEKRNLGMATESNIDSGLEELHLTRADIDVVLMTHMHNDHASGLTYYEDGKLTSTYPNAVIYINAIEWDEVRYPNDRTRNTYLKENWEPIQHQVKVFEKEIEVAPGITMVHTGGHSRGHSIVRLEQNGETMLHLADLLLSFVHTNPLWIPAVDDYPMDSIAMKKKLLKEAFENHYRFFFYHDPFYRVVEYSSDGKSIVYGKKTTKEPTIPMTNMQDKTHPVIGYTE